MGHDIKSGGQGKLPGISAEVSGPDDRLGRFGGADDDIYVGEALDHLIKGNCFAAKLGR